MKKRVLTGLLILVLLALSGCARPPAEEGYPTYRDGDGFERFLEEIQPSSEPWTKEEKAEYLSWLQPETFDHPFTVEDIKPLLTRKPPLAGVSLEQAKADVELAFDLLAYGYGGYTYFGGDEVFLSIRDGILAELEEMGGFIETADLCALLWENLSDLVVDRHFSISADSIYYPDWDDRDYVQSTWYVPDLYFDDPTGIDPQYVKHTIGPDGAITYCLAVVRPDSEGLPRTMTVEGVERTLEWKKAAPAGVNRAGETAVYWETEENGIPVLAQRSLQNGYQTKLKEFLASASKWREEPLFILDLRGHVGGNDSWATQWLTDFTGKGVAAKSMWCIKGTNLSVAAWENAGIDPETAGLLDSLGHWSVSVSRGTVWKTDNTIFVLTDGNVGSAGEGFLSLLNMGKRVVLVGSNTAGDLCFGNVGGYFLPNSGIALQFGASISFRDKLENNEGVGYLPDLWVPPNDSLDAVARLCEYYGLK